MKYKSGRPIIPMHYRHFGGQSFMLQSRHKKKSIAKKNADAWRRGGYKARVIKTSKGYEVYLR